MKNLTKLVYGVGINDADYSVHLFETSYTIDGKRKVKLKWKCPYYSRWKDMLMRCYSLKCLQRHPTYRDCYVCDEWLVFSNFKAWMEQQDWEGKHLDKDLLIEGNKVYSPNACVFIDQKLNKFLLECYSSRGEYPIGVSWNKRLGKFVATCNNPITGKSEHLGVFIYPNEAHLAWKQTKHKFALDLANTQKDPRVVKALINRYKGEIK